MLEKCTRPLQAAYFAFESFYRKIMPSQPRHEASPAISPSIALFCYFAFISSRHDALPPSAVSPCMKLVACFHYWFEIGQNINADMLAIHDIYFARSPIPFPRRRATIWSVITAIPPFVSRSLTRDIAMLLADRRYIAKKAGCRRSRMKPTRRCQAFRPASKSTPFFTVFSCRHTSSGRRRRARLHRKLLPPASNATARF